MRVGWGLSVAGLVLDFAGAWLLAHRLVSGVEGVRMKARLLWDGLIGRAPAADVTRIAMTNAERPEAALRGLVLLVLGFLLQLAGTLLSAPAGAR